MANTASTSLFTLPMELHLQIIEYLPTFRDIYSLLYTNRYFSELFYRPRHRFDPLYKFAVTCLANIPGLGEVLCRHRTLSFQEFFRNSVCVYRAVEMGTAELIRSILDIGVDVNRRYSFHYEMMRIVTMLHIACKSPRHTNKKLRIVRLLIERGADIDAKDSKGHTALYYAFKCQFKEAIQLLAENGAEITGCNSSEFQSVYKKHYIPRKDRVLVDLTRD
ncbi:ankyrin repeat-containing domain protein [Trichophaea hybrida]|nr:ankyrin repeat-containing domain protein [Trichophaea hybrida]